MFPDDVGSTVQSVQYTLLEMHYNNVKGRLGISLINSKILFSFGTHSVLFLLDFEDLSVLEFFYRTTPSRHDATILEVGQYFL